MNLKSTIKFYLLLSIVSLSLHAGWQPCYLAEYQENKEILNDPAIDQLEKRVIPLTRGGWCSEEKAKLIMELVALTRPSVCVEIGAFAGASTLPMLSVLQYLGSGYAYVIEPWSNYEASRGLGKNDHANWWTKVNMNSAERQFRTMIKEWKFRPIVKVLPYPSQKAVNYVNNINFLQIDGNFSEAGSLSDSQLYVPKVAPGGYILISNVLVMVDGKAPKMRALWPLFDQCEIVCEIDNGNTLLFRKL